MGDDEDQEIPRRADCNREHYGTCSRLQFERFVRRRRHPGRQGPGRHGRHITYDPNHLVNDGQPIELGYWSWGDESTDPVISMLREYEKIHPNVTFKISQVAWSDYWVKTPLSRKGNKNAPVLFNVHNSEAALLRPHAARLDGASDWRIFHQVVLPMSRNSIAALAIFTFLWNWEDYLWPFLMIADDDKQLLSVGIKMFSGQYGTDYGGLFAATSVTIIPVAIAYLVFQKQFIEGIALTGTKA